MELFHFFVELFNFMSVFLDAAKNWWSTATFKIGQIHKVNVWLMTIIIDAFHDKFTAKGHERHVYHDTM